MPAATDEDIPHVLYIGTTGIMQAVTKKVRLLRRLECEIIPGWHPGVGGSYMLLRGFAPHKLLVLRKCNECLQRLTKTPYMYYI